MTKKRQAKTNVIGVVRCIKVKDANILVQYENIKDRCREYFDELFNNEQGYVVGDTIITFSDENKEFMPKKAKLRGGWGIEKIETKESG